LRAHAHLGRVGLVQHFGGRLPVVGLPSAAEPLFASGRIIWTSKARLFIWILRTGDTG
jgi:hypothetical protein